MNKNKNISNVTLDDIIKKNCKNEEFKDLYEKELIKNNLSYLLIETRQNQGLTQEELAKKVETKQASISRLEKGNSNKLPSLEFLYKISKALNKKLIIRLE
jgi:DNA-binding XRE family transcriptional regulator